MPKGTAIMPSLIFLFYRIILLRIKGYLCYNK